MNILCFAVIDLLVF